jgi:hypothetical protein
MWQTGLASRFQTCNAASACSGGLTCKKGGCVDESSLQVQNLYTTQDKPNHVYFVFSLWDKNCNAAAFSAGDLEVQNLFVVYDNDARQSKEESFNGLIPSPKVCFRVWVCVCVCTYTYMCVYIHMHECIRHMQACGRA